MNKLFVIGTNWPEPSTTAAGSRMIQLLNFFRKNKYEIYFGSTAEKSTYSYKLSNLEITCYQLILNHTSFNELILKVNPSIVLFDRYITEEQFGWRVSEICPNAMRVLDTEDLHFLRNSRLQAIKNQQEISAKLMFEQSITKREIASIYRCDLSLIISTFEYNLLVKNFKIDSHLLLYLPFLLNPISKNMLNKFPNFYERKNFMTIGNFKHEPNVLSTFFLKNHIWPSIKKIIPDAQLTIYGAYAPKKIEQLHNEKEGFLIKGWIPNEEDAYKNAKVCLAPIEVGAGLKGKLVKSMQFGTPNITTTIGAEGMFYKNKWNGFIANNPTEFVSTAIELYTNETSWNEAQNNGITIYNKLFSKKKYETIFIKTIFSITKNLSNHRLKNFIGSLLMHHSMQSTKYLSKYVEEKNSKKIN